MSAYHAGPCEIILQGLLFHKLQVKQSEEIYQLIGICIFTQRTVLSDESTVLQFLKLTGQASTILALETCDYFIPYVSGFLPGKKFHYLYIFSGFLEKRRIQVIKLILEFGSASEEEIINILIQASILIK